MRIFKDLHNALQENTGQQKKLCQLQTETNVELNRLTEIMTNAFMEITEYFDEMTRIEKRKEEADIKRTDETTPTEDDLRF